MSNSWNKTILNSENEVLQVLNMLYRKQWLCRGQSKCYGGLVPVIDRKPRENLTRCEKLKLERQSIDLFRSTVQFFADSGEEKALTDDIIALMVLRHYEVPTRLLDWSLSPYVAAYFASHHNDIKDGEIWSFDRPLYELKGRDQWKKWPETTSDCSGDSHKFKAQLTAFTVKQPPNWFICAFYRNGFPRQIAQKGAYSMTARFGRDHAKAIAYLLNNSAHYHQYIIKAKLKRSLRNILREKHGIWRGSLFPDSAGAADTVIRKIFPKGMIYTH